MGRRSIVVEELELPFPPFEATRNEPVAACRAEVSPFGTFASCPMCDGEMTPEHAHFRCRACGWRDSCCD